MGLDNSPYPNRERIGEGVRKAAAEFFKRSGEGGKVKTKLGKKPATKKVAEKKPVKPVKKETPAPKAKEETMAEKMARLRALRGKSKKGKKNAKTVQRKGK